jgi:FAD/FMN-containing dehydrogenase
MNAIEYLTLQAQALPAAVRRRVDDLTDEQLVWRPQPRSNHVGFIAWHCLRACDMQLGRVRGVGPDGEVWQTGGFSERTGYDPRGLGARGIGIGTGYTLAMVDAVPVSKALVTEYADAVAAAYVAQLGSMVDANLDAAALVPEGSPPAQAHQSLEVALRQFYQHMGECDFLRGLIGIPDPTMPSDD